MIGRGKAARVYKIEGKPHALARKEFSPILPVRLWNDFFYSSPHPLATETGIRYAYWKRRLAHRLCALSASGVRIPDAVEFSRGGFILRFVEGLFPGIGERRTVYSAAGKLEIFFNRIGMPAWSFSRLNPFSISNFILKDREIYVIDYEQSVPVPDARRNINYDTVYFDDVRAFIESSKKRIVDKLGERESRLLTEAFERARECYAKLDIRPRAITRFINSLS